MFSARDTLGTIIFTVVEYITLGVWLVTFLDHQYVLSAVVLFVGLFLEHYIATLVGRRQF